MSSLLAKNEFEKQQWQVKGLLLIQLESGETAGAATQRNATITEKKHKTPRSEHAIADKFTPKDGPPAAAHSEALFSGRKSTRDWRYLETSRPLEKFARSAKRVSSS